MKIVKLNSIVEISAVVRTAPSLLDVLVLKLKNETTNLLIELPLTWYIHKNRLVFTIDTIPADFKAGNKYEIEIFNETSSKIIYLGNLLVVKEDTDIQNYTPSKQKTQRFKTKV